MDPLLATVKACQVDALRAEVELVERRRLLRCAVQDARETYSLAEIASVAGISRQRVLQLSGTEQTMKDEREGSRP